MPPISGADVLLGGRQTEEERWRNLAALRLRTIKPLLGKYVLPTMEDVLLVPELDGLWRPLMLHDVEFFQQGRRKSQGIFSKHPDNSEEFQELVWWGLTSKYQWVRIEGHYELDDNPTPSARRIQLTRIIINPSYTVDDVAEFKGWKWICELLGDGMRWWEIKYSPLARAIEEFGEQDRIIRALHAQQPSELLTIP
jgi:hypothetical protein